MVSAIGALRVLAGAHAARADDAQVIVEAEIRIAGVDRLAACARAARVSAPAKRDSAMPCAAASVSSSQRLASGQLPMGCSETYSSSTPRRSFVSASLCVCTFMPAATSVVHEAGKPLRPSISTRHTRQEPKALSVSVAQSFGTSRSASAAARMIDVPAGTVTVAPSISSVTCSPVGGGRSQIVIVLGVHVYPSHGRRRFGGVTWGASPWKILAEMFERAAHRKRRQAAKAAQRTVEHGVAEFVEQREVRSCAVGCRWHVARGCDPPAPRRASNRCGTACTCRRIRWRRTPARNAPCAPCRRVSSNTTTPPWPSKRVPCRQRLVLERRVELPMAVDRRRAARRSARRAPAGRWPSRHRSRSTSSFTVSPKARSTRPPRFTLPASCSGMVPRDLPTPKSR